MLISFYERQLSTHLKIDHGRVFFLAMEEGGFCLFVWDGRHRYVLKTQREKVRVFKDLTKAAAYVHAEGLTSFTVCMSEEALLAEIEPSRIFGGGDAWDESFEDLIGEFDDEPQRPRIARQRR
ncbi:hypothetical protein [Pseudomonas aeruginosa]|uniref:hypothetical protein n=1 Tax=Pseudomonas aeruginosa TaxID=287 RepID=UPI00070FB4B1|nr:hypothetical protein [Pseudomonas aeruginosa]HBN9860907.1 hypothetical protein [Pseudomonas aeruginosa]HBN9886124.1 hypothetical protein [Pseudomonas aeruginosa]